MLFIIILSVAFIIAWCCIHHNNGWGATVSFGLFIAACFIFVPDTTSFLTQSWGLLLTATGGYFIAGSIYTYFAMRTWLGDIVHAANAVIINNKEKLDRYSIGDQLDKTFNCGYLTPEYPFYEYPPDFRSKQGLGMIMRRCVWWPICLIDTVLTDWLIRSWRHIAYFIANKLQKVADRTLPKVPKRDSSVSTDWDTENYDTDD